MKNILKLTFFSFIILATSCNTDDEHTCTDGILNGNETGIDCGGDCDLCITCEDGIMNGTETGIDCGGNCPDQCYGAGLSGEAGGIIFYDKGAVTDGWRYLEAADGDFELNGNLCWGSIQYENPMNTDNNVGTGLENTMSLSQAMNGETIYTLAVNHTEGGKSDWFVPSKDELTLIFENKDFLPNLANGGSECTIYWGSTLEQIPNGSWLAECMDPSNGSFVFTNPNQRVRFVRRF